MPADSKIADIEAYRAREMAAQSLRGALSRPATLQSGGPPPTLHDMERVTRLETVVERIEKDLVEIKSDGKATRTTVLVSALALAGLIVAIWQAQLSQMANMLSAFQSGLSAMQSAAPAPAVHPMVIQVQPAPVMAPPAPAADAPQR